MTQNGNEPPSPSSRPKPPSRSEGFVSEVMSKVSAGAPTDPAKKTPKPEKSKKSKSLEKAPSNGPLFIGMAVVLLLLTGFGISSLMGGRAIAGTIQGGQVPYYACPGVGELGNLGAGEPVEVSGRTGDWMVVHADATGFETVYIHSDFVSLDGVVSVVAAQNCDVADVQAVVAESTTTSTLATTSSVELTTTSVGETTTTAFQAPPPPKPPRKGRTTPTTTTTTTTPPPSSTTPTTKPPTTTTPTTQPTTTTDPPPPSSSTTTTDPP